MKQGHRNIWKKWRRSGFYGNTKRGFVLKCYADWFVLLVGHKGYGERCRPSSAAFRRVGYGTRLRSFYIRRALRVERLEDCESACAEARDIQCRSFNFRLVWMIIIFTNFIIFMFLLLIHLLSILFQYCCSVEWTDDKRGIFALSDTSISEFLNGKLWTFWFRLSPTAAVEPFTFRSKHELRLFRERRFGHRRRWRLSRW